MASEAFLSGIPIVTSGILLMDQRYWAARCAEFGSGCEGIAIDAAFVHRVTMDRKAPLRTKKVGASHVIRPRRKVLAQLVKLGWMPSLDWSLISIARSSRSHLDKSAVANLVGEEINKGRPVRDIASRLLLHLIRLKPHLDRIVLSTAVNCDARVDV